MAQYPIKMLKDENGTPFVPLVAPEAVKDTQGTDWQTLLNRKLEKTNIIAGQNVTITTEGNDITINSAAGGASANVIDNLDQTTGGVGVLDAHQGHVLKEMIPDVVNNLTTVDTTKALSAYQGYLLNNRVVPGGGATGQVLKKKSATDNDLEWGDAASAVGDALPIGTLSPFVGLIAPKGYLICMGQLVDKAEYPELWELCGNTFGQSTTTQFYLPDLRGVTIAGYKQGDSTFGTLGALIGGLTHTHTVPGVKHSHSISHTHGVPGVAHTHTINSHYHWLPTFDYGQGMGVLDTSRLHKRTTGITPPQDAGNWWFQKSGDTGVTSGGTQWGTADSGTLTSNSTTPSATTTNSQSTTTSGETTPSSAVSEAGSSIQPTVVMNWIIKASMIAVIESNIEDSLTSTSATDALSARQGKVLNDKFDSYSLSTHTHGLLHNDFTVLLPNSTTDNGWSLINPTYTGYLLKSIRGNSKSPSWFTSNYAAGIAFGGADTKGVISLSYNANERITKFAGGNGTGPTWWYGIKGASGTTYDLADIKTKVDSNSWSSSVTLYNSGGDQVYYRVNTGLKLVSVTGSAPAGSNVLGTIPYKPHDKSVWVEIPTGGSARGHFSIDTSGKLTTYNQDSSSHGFYIMYTYN